MLAVYFKASDLALGTYSSAINGVEALICVCYIL